MSKSIKEQILLAVFLLLTSPAFAQEDVRVTGKIADVMKGQLHARIRLDTILPRLHLYGLGPAENLTGEIVILDGHPYYGTVKAPGEMRVTETYNEKAAFFVYTHVADWIEYSLPDSVQDIKQLEDYLKTITQIRKQPFVFRLEGMIPFSMVHILDLPAGSVVKKPAQLKKAKVYHRLSNVKADIVGFFSTQHEGVFTHKGSYIHMHLVTADKLKMGHVDHLQIAPSTMKLYLPK